MKEFIVYTEIINWNKTENAIERWYYGTFNNETRANQCALALGCSREDGIWHCVCDKSEVESLGIKNLPYAS